MTKFYIGWQPGSSAQIEVFSPVLGSDGVDPPGAALYQVKYMSPYRPAIRPPAEKRPLGPDELDPITSDLDTFVASIGLEASRSATAPLLGASSSVNTLITVGNQLMDLILPRYVQTELREDSLFLDIGVDEALLGYPWELMHDGEFLCLKHFMGRFVNAAEASPASQERRSWVGARLDEIRVLVVSVPAPDKARQPNFDRLPEAEAETTAIMEVLTSTNGVVPHLLMGRDATRNNVYTALRNNRYTIVHFNGHATFDQATPNNSAIILYDGELRTGSLHTYLSRNPPVLCFVNACESSKAEAWHDRYNIYGVAQAILQTGAYLLGSRWKLEDKAAAQFAPAFYTAWLGDEKSLGEAVRYARIVCKDAMANDDFAWASYVLYGDPRVTFRRVPDSEVISVSPGGTGE